MQALLTFSIVHFPFSISHVPFSVFFYIFKLFPISGFHFQFVNFIFHCPFSNFRCPFSIFHNCIGHGWDVHQQYWKSIETKSVHAGTELEQIEHTLNNHWKYIANTLEICGNQLKLNGKSMSTSWRCRDKTLNIIGAPEKLARLRKLAGEFKYSREIRCTLDNETVDASMKSHCYPIVILIRRSKNKPSVNLLSHNGHNNYVCCNRNDFN